MPLRCGRQGLAAPGLDPLAGGAMLCGALQSLPGSLMASANRYPELILYKAIADLRAEAARTYVGMLWWVLDPIIFMAIFYLVFAVLLHGGTQNYVQFLLIGLIPWRWFQSTVMHGANAIASGQDLMRQVYLPKVIFPLVVVLSDLFKFMVVLVLILAFLWSSGFPPNSAYLALPLVLILELLLIMGLAQLLAALVPFLPDLMIAIDHVLQLLFFLSGIFFDASRIPEAFRLYFYLNPMAALIASYRSILLHGQWPSMNMLLWVTLLSLATNLVAWRVLRHCDRLYPKLVVG